MIPPKTRLPSPLLYKVLTSPNFVTRSKPNMISWLYSHWFNKRTEFDYVLDCCGLKTNFNHLISTGCVKHPLIKSKYEKELYEPYFSYDLSKNMITCPECNAVTLHFSRRRTRTHQ